jgi:hypothetical protein
VLEHHPAHAIFALGVALGEQREVPDLGRREEAPGGVGARGVSMATEFMVAKDTGT